MFNEFFENSLVIVDDFGLFYIRRAQGGIAKLLTGIAGLVHTSQLSTHTIAQDTQVTLFIDCMNLASLDVARINAIKGGLACNMLVPTFVNVDGGELARVIDSLNVTVRRVRVGLSPLLAGVESFLLAPDVRDVGALAGFCHEHIDSADNVACFAVGPGALIAARALVALRRKTSAPVAAKPRRATTVAVLFVDRSLDLSCMAGSSDHLLEQLAFSCATGSLRPMTTTTLEPDDEVDERCDQLNENLYCELVC